MSELSLRASHSGEMVPLDALADVRYASGPETLFVPLFFKLISDRRLRESRSPDEILREVRHAYEGPLRAAYTPQHPG